MTPAQLRGSFEYHWVVTRVVLTAAQRFHEAADQDLAQVLRRCLDEVLGTTLNSRQNVGTAAHPCTLADVVRQDSEKLLRQTKELIDG